MWPGMPFSAFRSSATNCVTYLRLQCSSERTGKCRISIGYQPRSATRPVPNASWLPRPIRTSATPRCADLKWMLSGCGWNDGVAEPRGHPLGEEAVVVRPRNEVPPRAAHDAVARRERPSKSVAEVASARPPELVGVRVQDPVRAELGRREARHPRHPLALAQVVARLADEMQMPVARVALEDLRRPVLGAVVGRDDEVDAGVEVERDLGIHDVRLVADEERHDELHRQRHPRCRARRSPRRAQARRSGPRRRVLRIPSKRELRPIRPDRAPLGDAVARAHRRACERRRALPATRTAAPRTDPGLRQAAGWREGVEPGVVGMRERRARHEHDVRSVHDLVRPLPRRPRRRRAARSRRCRTEASAASRRGPRTRRDPPRDAPERPRPRSRSPHGDPIPSSVRSSRDPARARSGARPACAERAQLRIDAPSESTPSSECGDTTTMRFPDVTRPYDRGLDRLATIRSGGRPSQASSRSAGVRRLAPIPPAEARRPSPRHADRPELGLRAGYCRSTASTWNGSSARMRPTSAAACWRSRRPTTRTVTGAASSASTSSWRRRATRRRRSSATSPTRRRSRATPSTARSSRRRCSSSTTCRSALADAAPHPCPGRRAPRHGPGHHEDLPSRGRGSTASGGTTRAARCDGSPRRLSAPATSTSRPTGTCSPRRVPLRTRVLRPRAGGARRPRPARASVRRS